MASVEHERDVRWPAGHQVASEPAEKERCVLAAPFPFGRAEDFRCALVERRAAFRAKPVQGREAAAHRFTASNRAWPWAMASYSAGRSRNSPTNRRLPFSPA